jgi:hypothetical protein
MATLNEQNEAQRKKLLEQSVKDIRGAMRNLKGLARLRKIPLKEFTRETNAS